MNENHLFYASLVGIVLILVSWMWLVIVAWRQRLSWGLAAILFPPSGLLFAVWHFRSAAKPFALGLVGLLMTAGPPTVSRLLPVDLGPREKLVDGEKHLTLTGWDRQGYGLLRTRADVVVLQMANPDVTDQTLQLLGDMKQLRELDLNDTQVTDAGLAQLARLPALERLRLANTRITDAGFREHLSPSKTVVELDLRGTSVAPETISAWRKAQRGRRALR